MVVGCYGGEMGLGAATKARWLAFFSYRRRVAPVLFVLEKFLTSAGVWLEMSGHGKAARRAARLAPARGAI